MHESTVQAFNNTIKISTSVLRDGISVTCVSHWKTEGFQYQGAEEDILYFDWQSEEVTGGCRKLQNDELHYVYSLPEYSTCGIQGREACRGLLGQP